MYSGDLSLLPQCFEREMDRLIYFYNKYYKKNEFNSICVAVSGGADSVTLLLLLEKWCRKNNLWRWVHNVRKALLRWIVGCDKIYEKRTIRVFPNGWIYVE